MFTKMHSLAAAIISFEIRKNCFFLLLYESITKIYLFGYPDFIFFYHIFSKYDIINLAVYCQ